MKRISLIVATLVACGAFSVLDIQAQQANSPRRGGGQSPRMALATPEQRVKSLTETLKLTEEQQTKLKAIFEEQAEAITKVDTSLSREARREAMQKMRTEQENKIKEVLTEDQYKTYNSSREFMQTPPNAVGQLTIEERADRLATALKLSDEQKTKFKELLVAQDKETREFRAGLQNMTAQERRAGQQKLRADQQAKIKELLGDDLYKEYQKQAASMLQGNGGQRMMTSDQQVERIANVVTITDEQKAKLKAYFEEQQKDMEKNVAEMQKLTNEERREAMQKSRTEQQAKLKEILGEELYKKYSEQQQRSRPNFGGGDRPQRRTR